ncbi:MAG TPA: BrnT family toxin [Chloroflexi bacterium]|nr:BrnT family toxin [Chloroflexota bacterium]
MTDFIWPDWVVEKILVKHGVEPEEVEEAFFNPPYKVRRAASGKYLLYGRSEAGRYLFIVFVWEGTAVRIITARDMTPAERRYFERK